MKKALVLLSLFLIMGCVSQDSKITANAVNKARTNTQKIYTSVMVGNIVGIDLNKSALTFGTIPYGGEATRWMTLKNIIYGKGVRVRLKATGNISDLIRFKENNFILRIDQEKNISVTVSGERYGFYDGYIIIEMEEI